MKRNEESLRDLWDDTEHTNIHIIGVAEGEEREKGPEKIFEEIITENFPNGNGKSHPSLGSAESPRQDKPREEHC